MSQTREDTLDAAKRDLATRLGVTADAIEMAGIVDKEFPDMSLGAPAPGEMAAQMIASGWIIVLKVGTESYEYRGDKYQLRLHNFEGQNYVIT